MSFDVVALGLNAVDILIRLPAQIRRDDKQMVNDLIIQGGAPTGSGACGVARLGYDVAFVARVGRNTLSAISLEELRNNGVKTDLVVQDDESRPAIALVEIDAERAGRTVFIQMDNYGYLRPDDIPAEAIREAKVLLVDSYDLDASEAALRAAVGSGCRPVLDFESGDVERTLRLLALGADAILPLAWAKELTGKARPEEVVAALAALGPRQAIVTDGVQGSWAWDSTASAVRHQPAFLVQSVDSTGCGDAYHAGYIVGLLEGWPLPRRMEFGALLAARVATRVGGRSALPWSSQVKSLLVPGVSVELQSMIETIHDKSLETSC